MQVQNIFRRAEPSFAAKSVPENLAFYGRPDEKYYLDDYTRFPTMEEVMREYIKGVQVRKRSDGFHFANFDLVNRIFFENAPLVLIDGMPFFNINRVFEFDPRQVKSLEVAEP